MSIIALSLDILMVALIAAISLRAFIPLLLGATGARQRNVSSKQIESRMSKPLRLKVTQWCCASLLTMSTRAEV